MASLVAGSDSFALEGVADPLPVGPSELEPTLLVDEREPVVEFEELPFAPVVGGDIPVAPLLVDGALLEGALDVPVTCGALVVTPGTVEEEGSVVAGPLDDVEQAAVETNRPATRVTFLMV